MRVRVNEGTRPITVVLQAQPPVIWDFEGLVWRVERAIVLSAGDRRAGVRGLPAERAEFPDLARCPRAIFPPWNAPEAQRDTNIEAYFGRKPDRAVFEGKRLAHGLGLFFCDEPRGVAPALHNARHTIFLPYIGRIRIKTGSSVGLAPTR